MAVCAITGVLAGKGKQLDLFGVVVLALVTALGGGTIRDLVLNISPLFWVADPYYVHTAVGAALVTFFVARFWELPLTVLLVADAFGLALFTMIGVEKSLACNVSPTIAIFLGVVTGVGGGLLRDVLSGEIPLVFRKEIYLYATAAFCGSAMFLLLERFFPGQPFHRVAAIATILGLRLAAIRWKLVLPMYKPRDTDTTSRNQDDTST